MVRYVYPKFRWNLRGCSFFVLRVWNVPVTTFDADSYFTYESYWLPQSLSRNLSDEELVQHTPTAFPALAGVNVREMYNHILGECASVLESHPPTWTELFRVLKEMGLSELASRMEKYWRGPVLEDSPRTPPVTQRKRKMVSKSMIICFVLMFKIPQMKHQSKKFSG